MFGPEQEITVDQEMQVEQFTLHMFQYLEALIGNGNKLNFPADLVKPMYDLYMDIATMYVVNCKDQLLSG